MSDSRGRTADSPADIPAAGLKDTALRVKDEISDDHTRLDEIKDSPEFDETTYRDESYRTNLGDYYASRRM